MDMDKGLNGKTALVTGGSRGIGRAVALALARHGVQVAICGRTAQSLEETVAAIQAEGGKAWGFQADVSRNEDLERLAAQVQEAAGGIDVLVNNAVTSTSARFDELTDDEFRYHIDVKLMAYIRMARLVAPVMADQKSGAIVNISTAWVAEHWR